MSDFKTKMHQIRFRLGLHLRPRWASLQCSPRPLAGFGGPKGSGGEGRGKVEGRKGKGRGLSLPKVNFLVTLLVRMSVHPSVT